MEKDTYDHLYELLLDLDGVQQPARYHPEGDALYHSLQAYQLARAATDDRQLWAAALLHDVGKATSGADHDAVGADLLSGWVSPRIVYLVRHHLDLLRQPRRARRRFRGEPALNDLERLRKWDVGGRIPGKRVCRVEEALDAIFEDEALLLAASSGYEHDRPEPR